MVLGKEWFHGNKIDPENKQNWIPIKYFFSMYNLFTGIHGEAGVKRTKVTFKSKFSSLNDFYF